MIPLRSQPRLWRLRVPLAAPWPEPKPCRDKAALANVNNHNVKEVMNRNNTASRRLPSSGYICGAADALRPALALPPERLNASSAPCHAAARLPNHGSHRRCRHLHRPVIPQRRPGARYCHGFPLAWSLTTRPPGELRSPDSPHPPGFHRLRPWPNCALRQRHNRYFPRHRLTLGVVRLPHGLAGPAEHHPGRISSCAGWLG